LILDSSAILAILLRQPQADRLIEQVQATPTKAVGTPTLAETGIVLVAKIGISGRTLLSRFLEEASVELLPFTNKHWPIAVEAFSRFGKGRHPAALNFGDCLTYATARLADDALLCIGDDFPQTDLVVVL
jgi:ribonuclease VapC